MSCITHTHHGSSSGSVIHCARIVLAVCVEISYANTTSVYIPLSALIRLEYCNHEEAQRLCILLPSLLASVHFTAEPRSGGIK